MANSNPALRATPLFSSHTQLRVPLCTIHLQTNPDPDHVMDFLDLFESPSIEIASVISFSRNDSDRIDGLLAAIPGFQHLPE